MATVLLRGGQDSSYSHAFVLIALQLIFSNLMAFLPQLIVVLPEILQAPNNLEAVLLLSVLLLYGIISNTLMATVLLRGGQDSSYSHAFVLIALQLIFSNLMAFLPQLIVVLPEILQAPNNLEAIAAGDFYYCTRKFLVWNLTWEGYCTEGLGDIWWRIRYSWALFIPNVMFVMYVAIFYSIRRKCRFVSDISQNQVKTYNYEWSMLIQAAWNCGVVETALISFNFLSPFWSKFSAKESIFHRKFS
ncbi:hypothetical protein DINM_005610 [Dirofilaria immitis]|nr:hypothetical protein [Dirofilaria immitis]